MQDDIINKIDFDLPIEPSPFNAMAKKLRLSEEEIILNIMQALNSGNIRRFGAIINHNLAGYRHNTMLVWRVPEDKIDEGGGVITDNPAISHCYKRRPAPDWPYNLYAMLHASSEEELLNLVTKLREDINNISPDNDFIELRTLKEYKKTGFRP